LAPVTTTTATDQVFEEVMTPRCQAPLAALSSAVAIDATTASVPYVSVFCGRVLARIRNDRGQVEPVRRTVASLVLFDSGRTSLEESGSSDAVTAGGMRQADTDLRETLPQVAFFGRTTFQRASKTSCAANGWPPYTSLRAKLTVSTGGSASSGTGSTPAAP